ncbi:MAG TPA: glycosyl hydrolase family 28-related protein [Candidatus Saccharimonadales bacterium]|nr:glycosyl hydrolase family 28-related protein [Candidatus Saccharimonadales bacterium]
MARLPVPGGDSDTWAGILNEFLRVSHNDDGTQKADSIPKNSVGMDQIKADDPGTQRKDSLVLMRRNGELVWRPSSSINVLNFGALGDGITDDTDAIQAAIDFAGNGGTVNIPRGTYMVRGLKVRRNGTTLAGEARYGTRLVRIKGSTAPLLDMSGTASMDGHLKYCSVGNITLHGNFSPGVLLRSYYADNCILRDVSFAHSDGLAMDFIEVWDTRLYFCVWENCGSHDEPATLFRNTMPQGQFGFGDDSTNQIHFLGCRWESFKNGAVKIDGAANGSSRLLNGMFFVSCKMETRLAAGSAFQIMEGSTIVFVNQLYIAIMAVELDYVKPLDAIEDRGSHIFMTDVYVQWGFELNMSKSLIHIWRSGPHMYYKIDAFYPLEDPVEAAIIVEPEAFEVVSSCNIINRGKLFKGDVSNVLIASARKGLTLPLDASGVLRLTSNVTNKDLFNFNNSGDRPMFQLPNNVDIVGYSDAYTTERWRLISSTGAARFASGKFQVEGTKGYVGINVTPFVNMAMLIRPAADTDRGVAVVRPSAASNSRLLEFQDEQYHVQGMAFDAHGRPFAVGTPPKVTAGAQVSYANPGVQVRDVAGNIVAAVRPSPTAPGTIATVTFSRPFAASPLSITLLDNSAINANLYVSARSASSFTVSTRQALPGGTLLAFDYQIIA